MSHNKLTYRVNQGWVNIALRRENTYVNAVEGCSEYKLYR